MSTKQIYELLRAENRQLRKDNAFIRAILRNLLEHCGCGPQKECVDCEAARAALGERGDR